MTGSGRFTPKPPLTERIARYAAIVGVTDEVAKQNKPEQWLAKANELFDGNTVESFILTFTTVTAARDQIADWVYAGFDPDPEYGLVDLDNGWAFDLKIEVKVDVGSRRKAEF